MEQGSNRRNSIMIGNKTLMQICKEKHLSYATIYQRIKKYNWPVDKALNTPIKSKGKKIE